MHSSLFLAAASFGKSSCGRSLRRNQPGLGYFDANHSRWISSRAARDLLGLPRELPSETISLTLKELRHAYFAAAKKCHPDMKPSPDDRTWTDTDGNSAPNFLQITHAYEVLQGEIAQNQDVMSTITSSEEDEFRHACQTVLGVDAEIVEECKRNPVFRQWLDGRTDAAYHWRTFFMQYGGLAPKLRPSGGRLAAGSSPLPPHTTRRKRR